MGVRSPGERHGNPLQYSCLENPMDRRAWWAAVRRVPQSRTRLKRVSTYDCTSEVPVGFGVLFCFIFLYIVCPSYTFWQASPAGKLHLLASFTCSQASPAGKLHMLTSFTCSQASHAHKLHMFTSSGSWWWTREAWCFAVHGIAKSQTQLSDWAELSWTRARSYFFPYGLFVFCCSGKRLSRLKH